MKIEEVIKKDKNGVFTEVDIAKMMKEYTKIKCEELLEIVSEKASISCKKKSQFGKYRKWQKVKDDEEIDLFSYEVQYSVNKDSILNAVDLEKFCS